MQKYDVVVVGAGNSGLTAACQLALKGKKTLLIEQHNIPGGCATSFVRGRFEFDPSLHEMCDFGTEENPGDAYQVMTSLGIKWEMIPVKDCFRVITKGSDGKNLDVTIPAGYENFLDAMEKYVPGCRSKMQEFLDLMDETLDGIHYMSESGGKPDSKVLMSKYANMLRTGTYSTVKVFKAMKMPKKCIDILSTYWSYLGVGLDKLPFIHYAAMVQKYLSRGAHIPRHTSHDLSVTLLERFRELGGDVLFNCRAEKFLFDREKDNRICGVETTCGTFECNYVLANINPDIIYGKMMPKDLVPVREKKLANAREKNYAGRMFTLYLGLDKTAEELGIKDYSIFLHGTADSAKEFKNMQKSETNDFSIFLCYNIVNPDFSPAGTCVCSFTKIMSAEDWNDVTPEEYAKKKTEIAEKMIQSLEDKAGIKLRGHIEEMEIATPVTFARYIASPEGSAYGYAPVLWDGMIPRMMMISKDYPIKGLRPIGTSGPRSIGYNGTYVLGQMMANFALKDMKSWEPENGGSEC